MVMLPSQYYYVVVKYVCTIYSILAAPASLLYLTWASIIVSSSWVVVLLTRWFDFIDEAAVSNGIPVVSRTINKLTNGRVLAMLN